MDSITFDLTPSEECLDIAKQVFESRDPMLNQMGIARIAQNLSNYDNFCLAGRLLINNVVRSIRTLDLYLALNKNILAPHIVAFIEDNKEVLQQAVDNSGRYNYINQDLFSADTLCESYLLRSLPNKSPTETPVLKNLRIAVQLYYTVSVDRVLQAFMEMNECYYTHASPTIYNAGCLNPQMASCFLMNVDDSLDSMMYTGVGDMSMISRYNGGIGIGLNNIRHSDIGGTGDSAGVIPYARVVDKSIGYVDQSRRRRGAATGYLNVWHIDVLDFIKASSNFIPQDRRLVDLHTCIWMHNLFYERCISNSEWTLFCPNTVKDLKDKYGLEFETIYKKYEELAPIREKEYLEANEVYDNLRSEIVHTDSLNPELLEQFRLAEISLKKAKKGRIIHQKVPARSILQVIADTQIKSSKPYVMNGDACNNKSNQQNIGKIRNSNLCVEIVQYSDPNTFSSCNLASINLPRFAKGKYIAPKHLEGSTDLTDDQILEALSEAYDLRKLGQICRSLVENLNKVIDHNFYPFDESKIKDFNMATRPLGIGISGLDDAFKILDLVYVSREAKLLNKLILHVCIIILYRNP